LQDPKKFTHFGIFGLKIHHLANLHVGTPLEKSIIDMVHFIGQESLEYCVTNRLLLKKKVLSGENILALNL
jgi:predicted nucleotide-binding protein (sugar kinase/HSP70/actin superfamily)